MPKFHVSINRSASQTVVVEVEAFDKDAAEQFVHGVLGQSHKRGLGEIEDEFHVVDRSLEGDDESSWEVCDVDEAQ